MIKFVASVCSGCIHHVENTLMISSANVPFVCIAEYVTCHMCRGVQTKLVRDPVSRMYFMHCDSCGASRAVTAVRAGYHATGRGERRAARQNP